MTEYVVLRQEGEGRFRADGTYPARSASAAIREHLDSLNSLADDGSGTYVAVPARSWRPVTVKVETKTELKFS